MKKIISNLLLRAIAPLIRGNLVICIDVRRTLKMFVYTNGNRSRTLTALVNSMSDLNCLLAYAKNSNRKVILNIFESLTNRDLRKSTFNSVIQITKDTDSDATYKVLPSFDSGIYCRCRGLR